MLPIAMGLGERDTRDCVLVALGAESICIGFESRVELPLDGTRWDEDEADTGDACGATGPLLKGLRSQLGASFDVSDGCELVGSRERSAVFEEKLEEDRLERTDRIDD
jgi:hypothetical protein